MNLKTTTLFEEHQRRNARIIPFAGWKMPIFFSNPKEEHLYVRKEVGIFDVSHMGEIRVRGKNSLKTLSMLLVNNPKSLKEGQSQYTLFCNDEGGIIDDLILYCIKREEDYLLCVNAGCIEKDFNWMQTKNSLNEVQITNESEIWGQIAVQGPKARKLTSIILDDPSLLEIHRFNFKKSVFESEEILISRTGYTGEDGFEILYPASKIPRLWQYFLKNHEGTLAKPIGLAARDTLRLEMKYPLNGQDMTPQTTPLEMGLKWVLKNSSDFIGKKAIEQKGTPQRWVGFQILKEGGIPRQGYLISSESNKVIGRVTSGALSPSLNYFIGTGMIQEKFCLIGEKIFVSIHGKQVLAKITPTPFYTI